MKAPILLILAATILLSAGCSGALPLDNGTRSGPSLEGQSNPPVPKAAPRCGGTGISLSPAAETEGATQEKLGGKGDRLDRECKAVPRGSALPE